MEEAAQLGPRKTTVDSRRTFKTSRVRQSNSNSTLSSCNCSPRRTKTCSSSTRTSLTRFGMQRPHHLTELLLTVCQRCREVALGSLRAAVDAGWQSRDTVCAYRAAGGGLVQYDGECRERKQGAQTRDGEKEHSADGLLRHLCLLHVARVVGPVHMTEWVVRITRSAAPTNTKHVKV